MIQLITGATGDVGSKVVNRLLERGERPRILVRNVARAAELFGDRVEIHIGDLSNRRDLDRAFEGVGVCFLVNSGPQIPERDRMAAQAARAAGNTRLVKLSSMDVNYGLAIGAWHEKGEEAIRSEGIPFTFLQPGGFMSNLLAWAASVRNEGVVRSSTGEGRRAFIHSDDIAAVAVEAMTFCAYEGRSLVITGPEALTFGEVTARISGALGRQIEYRAVSDGEARERYLVVNGSSEETEAHVALWRAIREDRLAMVTNQVEQILGRKPIVLDQWLAENATAFG
jgi:uncharacterized protein YbjT (DUF2867 family)